MAALVELSREHPVGEIGEPRIEASSGVVGLATDRHPAHHHLAPVARFRPLLELLLEQYALDPGEHVGVVAHAVQAGPIQIRVRLQVVERRREAVRFRDAVELGEQEPGCAGRARSLVIQGHHGGALPGQETVTGTECSLRPGFDVRRAAIAHHEHLVAIAGKVLPVRPALYAAPGIHALVVQRQDDADLGLAQAVLPAAGRAFVRRALLRRGNVAA